ncbi:hypothetical protein D6833_07370 [Candidatus Parcubacteria bacterium]|nr:MAG: hypothetical protein D6833_07370 [Candidatus Parcubacteria bacterium]
MQEEDITKEGLKQNRESVAVHDYAGPAWFQGRTPVGREQVVGVPENPGPGREGLGGLAAKPPSPLNSGFAA